MNCQSASEWDDRAVNQSTQFNNSYKFNGWWDDTFIRKNSWVEFTVSLGKAFHHAIYLLSFTRQAEAPQELPTIHTHTNKLTIKCLQFTMKIPTIYAEMSTRCPKFKQKMLPVYTEKHIQSTQKMPKICKWICLQFALKMPTIYRAIV